MDSTNRNNRVKFGLPKGRMEKGVGELLKDAGIRVKQKSRAYRPDISLPNSEVKILKPQDIVEMLHLGSRDVGFAGADWVAELEADIVELFDTELDPVRLVAAAPNEILVDGALPKQPLRIASEYSRLTQRWIQDKGIDGTFIRCYGATEVFPPEDADCIVDNTSTGSTLKANNLNIVDTLMTSSTRLYANHKALEDKDKRPIIEHLVTLVRSVHDARKRVMLEVNVETKDLEKIINLLPAMRKPTVAQLYENEGYVVKAAVPSVQLPDIIKDIKASGGTDIVVTNISQLIP